MTALPAVSGGILSDIITWVRRIVKSPSAQSISDEVICDYINRFYSYDLPERIQLFEMKRQYTFETIPNIFEYPAPFTANTTPSFPLNPDPPPFISNPSPSQPQTVVPVYQMFRPPIYADGVQMGWYQSNEQFYNVFPELVMNEFPIQGDGTAGPFTVAFGRNPILRAYIDDLGNLLPYVYITTPTPSGGLQYIVDSGYVNASGQGILIQTDSTFQNIIGPPLTGTPPSGGDSGTVDYINGTATFTFLNTTIDQANIETQTSPFSAGFPRICLFFNNVFKLYPVPDRAYKIQVDAYLTPTVFFNSTGSVPFAYMSEYLARGAARKILSDVGDYEQVQFYEPMFREQENLVLRRSDRQRATQRTATIFSGQIGQNPWLYTQY
jgi:hypothetical protein